MACGSCGTQTKDGKPGGCQSNGGCSSGGCNRMNVHDWLMNLPFSDPESTCRIIEVSFNQGSRKDFYRNATLQHFEKGAQIAVEGVGGFDVGEVCLSGELVRMQLKKKGVKENDPDLRKVLRRANSTDLEKLAENKAREKDVLIRSRAVAKQLNLQMKIAEVEIQADGKKATFFYIADDRVDFRELIKVYAADFRVKVEMRQIGARQEAGKVGGIGSCGRELCCSTWLHDFKSVNTNAARYQNLSINQTKLSGQCGRLKCCLNYELDTYLDALQQFPTDADSLEITRGRANLVKKDIFKNLMWYTLPDSNKQYPLSIARVQEIKALNKQGRRPDELQPVELVSNKPKDADAGFVDLVGQISLRSLDKNSRRAKDRDRGQQGPPRQSGQPGSPARQGGQPQRPAQQGQPPRNSGRPSGARGPSDQKSQGQPNPRPPQQDRNRNPNRQGGPQRPPQQRPPQKPNPGGDAPA
jgi:cell fate regulator YaaT (PSP1 superfamily)